MARRTIQVQLDVEDLLKDMEKLVKGVADKVGSVDCEKLQSAFRTEQNRVNLDLTKIHGLIKTSVKDLQKTQEKADEKLSKLEKEIAELKLEKGDSEKAHFYKTLLLETFEVMAKSGNESKNALGKLRAKLTTGETRFNPIASPRRSVTPSPSRSNDSSLYN